MDRCLALRVDHSIRAFRAGMASRALRKIAPILASAEIDITVLMSYAMLTIAPLFAMIGTSLDNPCRITLNAPRPSSSGNDTSGQLFLVSILCATFCR